MAKYGSDVDVKSGGMGGGLAEGPGKAGEVKGLGGSGAFGTGSGYTVAKKAEKAKIKPLPVITPTEEPPAVDVAAAAVEPDEFGDGFDDGAGGDEAEIMAATNFAPGAAAMAKPTTKKMTPGYIRGNVAGRMFRRHFYSGRQ